MREIFTVKSTTFWSVPQGDNGYYGMVRLQDQDGQSIICYSMDMSDFFKYKEGMEFQLTPVSNKLDAKMPVDRLDSLDLLIHHLQKRVEELESGQRDVDRLQDQINDMDKFVEQINDRSWATERELGYVKQDVQGLEVDIDDIKRNLP